jgi:hypothetical protein
MQVISAGETVLYSSQVARGQAGFSAWKSRILGRLHETHLYQQLLQKSFMKLTKNMVVGGWV